MRKAFPAYRCFLRYSSLWPFRYCLWVNAVQARHHRSGIYQESHCKALATSTATAIWMSWPRVRVDARRTLWYQYPDWSRYKIASGAFTTDMAVGDIDGDGDLDVIIPQEVGTGNLYKIQWFENRSEREWNPRAKMDGSNT